jgi:hypothetical protein
MKMPLFRAALMTAVAVVVALPVAASAASLTIDDATGDTYVTKYDESTDTASYEPAGSQANVDLDRVRVKHTAAKVRATATYADLKRTSDTAIMYLLRLRTNEGLKRDLMVETFMSGKKGSVMFSKPNGNEAKCPGLDHAIDYSADTITVTVPRRCLSAPRFVEAFTVAGGISGEGEQYIDHGHMDKMKEKVVWSEKVRKS